MMRRRFFPNLKGLPVRLRIKLTALFWPVVVDRLPPSRRWSLKVWKKLQNVHFCLFEVMPQLYSKIIQSKKYEDPKPLK
jgi:hypothetical protein